MSRPPLQSLAKRVAKLEADVEYAVGRVHDVEEKVATLESAHQSSAGAIYRVGEVVNDLAQRFAALESRGKAEPTPPAPSEPVERRWSGPSDDYAMGKDLGEWKGEGFLHAFYLHGDKKTLGHQRLNAYSTGQWMLWQSSTPGDYKGMVNGHADGHTLRAAQIAAVAALRARGKQPERPAQKWAAKWARKDKDSPERPWFALHEIPCRAIAMVTKGDEEPPFAFVSQARAQAWIDEVLRLERQNWEDGTWTAVPYPEAKAPDLAERLRAMVPRLIGCGYCGTHQDVAALINEAADALERKG